MKSSLVRMRIIGQNKGDPRVKLDHNFSLPLDGLTQAAKDMKDMRTCYDSLLSAAAATANSAYEFSESLLEMGNFLLEKTNTHDDIESRGALSMLGKVQLELQKLVDIYRHQIIMTITNPSECLLSELRKVEEMKLQCDEKSREMFEYTVRQVKEKGKSRHGKGETFSLQQLKVVHDEYDDVARLCAFRVESLKQGQSRSLFTQAARHHAAQLNFFRKGLQSLEAVEPYIKKVSEKQHIDYELSETDEGENDGGEDSYESNEHGELTFDYRVKEELGSAYTLNNSMDLNKIDALSAQPSWVKDVELQRSGSRHQWDQIPSQQPRAGSHSAPLYQEEFTSTYVLPTPAEAKGSNTTASGPLSNPKLSAGSSKNLWHSSPLDMEKPKNFTDGQFSAHSISKPQIVVEESSTYKHSLPLPPLAEGAAIPHVDTQSGFDAKKNTRQVFSGPITSKPSLNMLHTPISSNDTPQSFSGLLSHVSGPQSSLLVNVSHNASPALATSPKISELHKLPRPPDTSVSKQTRSIGALGHSAPLVNSKREVSPTNRNPFRQLREGSPLPLPQPTVSRSFSIPSIGQREASFHSGKVYSAGVASPPLTPISLLHMKSPNSGQIRMNAGWS
ncbi:uncharacterized protein At2g33490-like isoform X1 [Salvia splendens]|uniref:uncharacterized protein At2g33490-like isoform X1 n=1 Tax=Salvia splendens TaxID=180675 RepID=UPI001C2584BA|nr:uncharacterized protein At2g33490-like isoform X1 [Salvia splendens]